MKIGEVAAMAGVPTPTVRYYERRGLLEQTSRTTAGYRQYGPEVVRRLRFIKHAQELGFALEDVQRMLDLRPDDPAACASVAATTREKIRTVRQRLEELRRLERTLRDLVRECERHPAADPCPVLAVLSNEGETRGTASLARKNRRRGIPIHEKAHA